LILNYKLFQKEKEAHPRNLNRSKIILNILSLEQKAVNPITNNEEDLNQ
jgi:hypothetical protein